MIAERAERDAAARAIQDEARRAHGLLVAHVGDDPLVGAAPRCGTCAGRRGRAADRPPACPVSARRAVTLFGATARDVPEGPLRLAALTGAPLLPVFAARTGHRRYVVRVEPPIRLAATPRDGRARRRRAAARRRLERFVRAPTRPSGSTFDDG